MLSAKEAHELAQQQLSGEVLASILEIVEGKIRTAIKRGEFQIVDPLDEFAGLTSNKKEAVYSALRKAGYKVEPKGGDDPRDPRERSYIVVSFRNVS
jgi:hypothetical protein